MGIYKQSNSNIFWMSKTIKGIQYRKSTETDSKMKAKAIFEDWVSTIRQEIQAGIPAKIAVKTEAEKVIKLFELTKKYLEWCKGRQKSYRTKKYIIPIFENFFKDKPLSYFNFSTVEDFQDDLINKGHKPAYINKIITVFKHMFNKALDWELIDEVSYKKILKVKQLKGESKRLRYLSEEEAERLITNCEPHLKNIVITALNTGMRRGELLGLTWNRVDLKNRIILLDKTKNGERREIPINNNLYKTLSGITRHLKCDYVFYNPQTLKPYFDLERAWRNTLKKSHILDFHFHDLRHTFASWLAMKGIDLITLKELLGHKDIKMTLRYAHLSKGHIQKAVNLLDKINHSFIIVEETGKALNL